MGSARESTTLIDAPLEDCLAVILDMEAYPAWVTGYREVTVDERDGDGRPTVVSYSVGGFGMSASYTLAYSYGDDPVTVSFEQVEGDLTRSISGRYELTPAGGGTRTSYAAAVEPAISVPGLLRRRVEAIIMDSALKALAGEVRRRANS